MATEIWERTMRLNRIADEAYKQSYEEEMAMLDRMGVVAPVKISKRAIVGFWILFVLSIPLMIIWGLIFNSRRCN